MKLCLLFYSEGPGVRDTLISLMVPLSGNISRSHQGPAPQLTHRRNMQLRRFSGKNASKRFIKTKNFTQIKFRVSVENTP